MLAEILETMRALVFTAWRGTEVIHLERVSTPHPGEGQVLSRVDAAGVNFADIARRYDR